MPTTDIRRTKHEREQHDRWAGEYDHWLRDLRLWKSRHELLRAALADVEQSLKVADQALEHHGHELEQHAPELTAKQRRTKDEQAEHAAVHDEDSVSHMVLDQRHRELRHKVMRLQALMDHDATFAHAH